MLFCSLLCVEAADRPGLIVDLVKIITEINIDVISGEFDTEVRLLQGCLINSCLKDEASYTPSDHYELVAV